MKKKLLSGIVAIMVCLIGISVYHFRFVPAGNTTESRENILNTTSSKGKEWSIAEEMELDGCIISAAYSTDYKSLIAVFEPTLNGGYQFSSSTSRDGDEIIVGGAMINGNWYDLIWFNGAQTEYAEITYTVNGSQQEAFRYDTADMDLICHRNSEKEYSMNVAYYDSKGNRYE